MAMEPRHLFNFIQGSDITGESSYDIWKRLGNEGSEADFLDFIRSGPKGEPAHLYGINTSELVMKKDLHNVLVPSYITFNGFYRTGSDVTKNDYAGRFIIQESTNGSEWDTKYTSTEDEVLVNYTPSSSDISIIRCTLYTAGDTTNVLDEQSVVILSEVKPDELEVLSAVLSNDAHVVATDYKGENGEYDECISSIRVFSGVRDVTADCTYETNTSNRLTGKWDSESYTYRVIELTNDTGYVDIIATYNEITVTKRFSISKAKRGKSAYEAWLEYEGNEGKTEEEYMSENQADWNETDDTKLGFIKNKPFYEETTEELIYIINNESITIENQCINNYFSLTNSIIDSETYTVIFDGQEYSCIAKYDSNVNGTYFGNQSLAVNMWQLTFSESITSEEPFFFIFNESANLLIASDGDHTISVYKRETTTFIKTLDEKFIPDTIKNGGSQSDWEQNDETAGDYIKNRPFSTYISENIIVDNYSSSSQDSQPQCTFVIGEKYKVVWNNVEYECICSDQGGYRTLGGTSNGYPFAIDDNGGNGFYVTTDDSEWTVSISQEQINIKTLDKKFIPNIGVDWEENDESAAGYINNKPFYEYYEGEPIYSINNQSITFYNGRGSGVNVTNRLVEGEVYTVIFDGQEYSCIARNDGYGSIYIGNQQKSPGWSFSENITSNEPFFFYTNNYYDFYVDSSDNGTHTITVYTGLTLKQKKIDEKFIPDTIARVDDIRNNFGAIKLNQLILVDAVNGYEYTIEMRNGTLVSSLAISSIKVDTNPTKFFYEDGEYFDPTGMVVKAVYSDGTSTEITNYTCSELIDGIVTIEYEEKGIKYTTELKVQTVESLLIDFEFINNGDNSFTLTGWKQTLNGEPSTELVTPILPSKYKIIL